MSAKTKRLRLSVTRYAVAAVACRIGSLRKGLSRRSGKPVMLRMWLQQLDARKKEASESSIGFWYCIALEIVVVLSETVYGPLYVS